MKRTLREFQVALGMKYSENKNSHNNRNMAVVDTYETEDERLRS